MPRASPTLRPNSSPCELRIERVFRFQGIRSPKARAYMAKFLCRRRRFPHLREARPNHRRPLGSQIRQRLSPMIPRERFTRPFISTPAWPRRPGMWRNCVLPPAPISPTTMLSLSVVKFVLLGSIDRSRCQIRLNKVSPAKQLPTINTSATARSGRRPHHSKTDRIYRRRDIDFVVRRTDLRSTRIDTCGCNALAPDVSRR